MNNMGAAITSGFAGGTNLSIENRQQVVRAAAVSTSLPGKVASNSSTLSVLGETPSDAIAFLDKIASAGIDLELNITSKNTNSTTGATSEEVTSMKFSKHGVDRSFSMGDINAGGDVTFAVNSDGAILNVHINTKNIDPDIFEGMKEIMKTELKDNQEMLNKVLEGINQMEACAKDNDPKGLFNKYKSFMSLLSDHVSIIAPISQLLYSMFTIP